MDNEPFGSQLDFYEDGYEWVLHSTFPSRVSANNLRVTFGRPQSKKPYKGSVLIVSAISFGSLRRNAILALNGGAKEDNFAHNTGEGGLSQYHLEKV